jgi:5-formyltetrahydrofolate cyclo-ligase
MGQIIRNDKQKLRKEILERRSNMVIDEEVAQGLSEQLFTLITSEKVSVIGCHLPFGQEPPLGSFLRKVLESGIKVLSPVSLSNGEMNWVRFDGGTKKGLFGFEEAAGEIRDPSQIEMMVMPALAVDMEGHRLGRGGGFYDRQLEKLDPEIRTVAVVFDNEIIDFVPFEAHDKKVRFAVSPSRTLSFFKRS